MGNVPGMPEMPMADIERIAKEVFAYVARRSTPPAYGGYPARFGCCVCPVPRSALDGTTASALLSVPWRRRRGMAAHHARRAPRFGEVRCAWGSGAVQRAGRCEMLGTGVSMRS